MNEQATGNEDLLALGVRLGAWQPEYPADRFSGRGIVICAGGARIFTNAYVLASVLRQTLGCTLPIEVWHFGPAEMSPSMAVLLEELDIRVVDALPHIAATGFPIRDGWQLKPFALQHCRFREVLLLDADQVPVRDPAELFDWLEYRDAGAVFWPDIVALRDDSPVWNALGLAARQTVSFESGQVLVDKSRHWRALSVVVALNAEAERLYQMIYGDKDTFLIGWQIAGASLAFVPHAPFIDERCLVQRDFAGAPLFQHRTNSKWSYSGEQHRIEGFVHADDCVAAIETLKSRWNGRIFHAPDRTVAARAAEAELAATGTWLLDVTADEAVTVDLMALNEIGAGRASDRQNWWCEEASGGVQFVIADADRVSYRLRQIDPKHWEGTRFRVPQHAASLRPATSVRRAAAPGLVDQLLRASGFPHESATARVELLAALRLICRVEPGALARLRQLETGASIEFASLVGAVAQDWEVSDVRRSTVLSTYYRPIGQDVPD